MTRIERGPPVYTSSSKKTVYPIENEACIPDTGLSDVLTGAVGSGLSCHASDLLAAEESAPLLLLPLRHLPSSKLR